MPITPELTTKLLGILDKIDLHNSQDALPDSAKKLLLSALANILFPHLPNDIDAIDLGEGVCLRREKSEDPPKKPWTTKKIREYLLGSSSVQ